MNALLKIDSIMFYVSDLEESAMFYQNVLGLKQIWSDKDQGMIGFVFLLLIEDKYVHLRIVERDDLP